MTTSFRFRGAILVAAASLLATATRAAAQSRETVRDGVVHLEDRTILEIPDVPRLETGLHLTVRRVDVGDAQLHVEEEGEGLAMVLINGGPGGTHHYFHPWFGRAAAYARVIYYDQRGTGLSDFAPGDDGYSVEQAVADLEAMRAALGVERWVLVGYSYGGFLAQYYTTTHPGRVAGMVLVGASPGMWADLGESRQYEYITQAETDRMRAAREELRALREAQGWSAAQYLQLLIYNNFLNGDWKRQHFYKPTPEEFARVPLYEWVNDGNFNSVMSRSANAVDLTGAFEESPIPTLLLEGKWDLTWGDEKPMILARNHPRARMTVVEEAGHGVFSENPDVFFAELEGFVRGLPPVPPVQVASYRRSLEGWRATWIGSPQRHLRAAGWGRDGSREIADAYTPQWLEALTGTGDRFRVGTALYDAQRYAEAVAAFVAMEEAASGSNDTASRAMALIWQGHMLDLLERRGEAVSRYQRVVDLNLSDGARHEQYGLAYEFTPYARERLEAPFRRIENAQP